MFFFNIKNNIALLLLLSFFLINSKKINHYEYHPFNIKYDFRYLKSGMKGEYKNKLIQEMQAASEFLSQMIYISDETKDTIRFSEDTLKHCYDKSISFPKKNYAYEDTDLIIMPLYAQKEKELFKGFICKQHGLKLVYLAILEISNDKAKKLIKKIRYIS